MATKTNNQLMNEIATASAEEAGTLGITPEIRETAAQVAAGSPTARSVVATPGTPIYNAMLGVITKIASTPFNYANYRDVYSRHHRNMIQGRPERSWMDVAKVGTGNSAQLETRTEGSSGSLTSLITAETPEIYSTTISALNSFVARVPISRADYRNAFTTETGVADLIGVLRQSLESAIIEQRNGAFDGAFTAMNQTAVLAENASPVTTMPDTLRAGTYKSLVMPELYTTLTRTGNTSSGGGINKDDLLPLYAEIKQLYYGMTGRPSGIYNYMHVKNNAEAENMVLYVDAMVYSLLNVYIDAFASDQTRLENAGINIVPMSASWLGTASSTGAPITVAAIGSASAIVDYPVNDETSVVPVDRGEIITRFYDGYLSFAPYEPFTFVRIVSAAG